jgi:hypothetical protein
VKYIPVEPDDDVGLPGWGIASIMVGSVLVAGGIVVGVYFFIRSRAAVASTP